MIHVGKRFKNAIAVAVLLVGSAGSSFAGHESNNLANLSGEGGVSGTAIVNYVAGTEGWTSNVHVTGLEDGIYTFAVRLNAGPLQPICNFVVDGNGSSGCSDQDAVLLGFNQAVIVDQEGNVVASGTFKRRGGNRDK